MNSFVTTINLAQETPSKKVLMGEIFLEGKIDLPVQGFIKWLRAKRIIERKLPRKKNETETTNERIVSYLQDSVTSTSENDIVEKLRKAYVKELLIIQTRNRANQALSDKSTKTSLAELVEINKQTDISESILSELEPFILALMNVEYFRFEVHNLHSPHSHIWRNKILHAFKKRFIEELTGIWGKLPKEMKKFFIDQFKNAYWRIHLNHPVHGFLGTILHEISEVPNYFHDSSCWFGLGADLNEEYLSKIPKENTGKRFWFSKVSAHCVHQRNEFRMNTLFFSTFDRALNPIDSDDLYSMENNRISVDFSDNAWAYSYYEDSCSYIETTDKSKEWLQKEKEPGEKEEYLWIAAYSSGHSSFRNAISITQTESLSNEGEGITIPIYTHNGTTNTSFQGSVIIGKNCISPKITAQGGMQKVVMIDWPEKFYLLGNTGTDGIFYAVNSDTVFIGEWALKDAYVGGGSFCGKNVKIWGKSLHGAKISGSIAEEAQISGYPLEECERKSYIYVSAEIRKLLENKANLYVKSIRSTTIERNSRIFNAILSIPFGQERDNISLSSEEISLIGKRLIIILSGKFSETTWELRAREIHKEWIESGQHKFIKEAAALDKREEWERIFTALCISPKDAVMKLEKYPEEGALFTIENWVYSYQDSLGISPEIARYVIEKIKNTIREIPIISKEIARSRTLIDIIKVINNITEKQDAQSSFQRAQFDKVPDDFFNTSLVQLIGEGEVRRVYEKHTKRIQEEKKKK